MSIDILSETLVTSVKRSCRYSQLRSVIYVKEGRWQLFVSIQANEKRAREDSDALEEQVGHVRSYCREVIAAYKSKGKADGLVCKVEMRLVGEESLGETVSCPVISIYGGLGNVVRLIVSLRSVGALAPKFSEDHLLKVYEQVQLLRHLEQTRLGSDEITRNHEENYWLVRMALIIAGLSRAVDKDAVCGVSRTVEKTITVASEHEVELLDKLDSALSEGVEAETKEFVLATKGGTSLVGGPVSFFRGLLPGSGKVEEKKPLLHGSEDKCGGEKLKAGAGAGSDSGISAGAGAAAAGKADGVSKLTESMSQLVIEGFFQKIPERDTASLRRRASHSRAPTVATNGKS